MKPNPPVISRRSASSVEPLSSDRVTNNIHAFRSDALNRAKAADFKATKINSQKLDLNKILI